MASLMRGLTSSALRVPVLTVVVVILLTGVFGALASQAQQDQGQESFSPDNEALTASEFASESFEGSLDTIVQVVVEGEDVVSPAGLQTVQAVQQAIMQEVPADRLSDAQGSPVISYLAPLQQAIGQGAVDPASLTDDASVDAAYQQAFQQLPSEQVGITEGLVATRGGEVAATDATTALVLVFLDTETITAGATDLDAETTAIIEAVKQVVDAVEGVDAPLETSAFAFELLFEQADSFTDEVGRLFATAALVILVILLLVYLFPPRGPTTRLATLRRAAADVGLTMFAILASIGWMQGIGVLLGPDYLGVIGPFTPPTQIIPILLIGLGVDYAIHVTTRYREEVAEGALVDEALRRAAGTVGVALLLATMTTALGFLTNLVNPVPAIQDFGILAAIGIAVAFLLMLTFLPAARLLLDRRAGDTLPREALGATSEGRLSSITAATAVLGERFAVSVVVVTLAAAGLGGYGLTQLSTEFSFTDFLPEDNPLLDTFETIEDDFGGGFGEQTTIVMQGDPATPEVHNATVAAVAGLADVEGVLTVGENAAAESVVSKLGRQLQLAAAAEQAAAAQAGGQAPPSPTSPPGAPQLDPAQLQAAAEFAQTATGLGLQQDLTVAADADVPAIYDALLAADPSAASVLAREESGYVGSLAVVQTQSDGVGALALASEVEDVFAPVEDALEPVGDGEATVTATGISIISDAIVDDLSSSQVSSLVVTLLAAMLLLVLVFGIRDRRPMLGFLTLLPVGFVLLWVFGMMAATGIPFGPVTSTISGLAIGIGVPFTIHITNRFTEDLEVHGEVDGALRSTLRHTGGALAGSALTTMAGFIILVTSSLVPFRQLGLVVAYTIGFSLIAAVLVLPSFLALWARSAKTPELHREQEVPVAIG